MNTTKKKLNWVSIWALGVGLVISGESFGWNLGWQVIGAKGFFVAVILAAFLYFCLVKCLVFLSIQKPDSQSYTEYFEGILPNWCIKVFSFFLLIEFLFIGPAIAIAIGEYISFLLQKPEQATILAMVFIVVFCLVSLKNIDFGAGLSIVLTLLAIMELGLFFGSLLPSFTLQKLVNQPNYAPFNLANLAKAMPFAIWMYLAIEGLVLINKDVEPFGFSRTISKGYWYAFCTLVALSFLVLIIAMGSVNLNIENWQTITTDNHPMPATLSIALGKSHIFVQLFTFIGLFGLIASLQSVALSAKIQTDHFIQSILNISPKNWQSVGVVLVVSLLIISTKSAAFMINLSALAALIIYIVIAFATLSYLRKAKRQSTLIWLYPLVCIILAGFTLVAVLVTL